MKMLFTKEFEDVLNIVIGIAYKNKEGVKK